MPQWSWRSVTRRSSSSTTSGPASWLTRSPNAIRFPTVPIVFCDTRKLAQEWAYRFLAAARVGLSEEMVGDLALRGLETAPPLAPAPPSPAEVRGRATRNNIVVSARGRIPAAVMGQYLEARARGET